MTRLSKRAIIYGLQGGGMFGNLKEISHDCLDRPRRATVNLVFLFLVQNAFKLN
jgi:hypothetical protein